jgi:2-dehydro-3-deoxyphosphogluconate aldolase / (4S)-4-hydroxy-2-oxoglutarate aldolase
MVDTRVPDIVRELAARRLIPVATIADEQHADGLAGALMRAGLSCVEITFRTTAAAEAIRRVRAVPGLLVGAGTVLSCEQAEAAADAGAHFAVAPGTDASVIDCCGALGLPFFPGVATPTEIENARRLGCRTLKLFPASQLGGPSFVRAVAAIYPDVRFVPTGGIGPEALAEYSRLSSVLACAGSWIAPPSLLRDGRFDEVERLAREAVAVLG